MKYRLVRRGGGYDPSIGRPRYQAICTSASASAGLSRRFCLKSNNNIGREWKWQEMGEGIPRKRYKQGRLLGFDPQLMLILRTPWYHNG